MRKYIALLVIAMLFACADNKENKEKANKYFVKASEIALRRGETKDVIKYCDSAIMYHPKSHYYLLRASSKFDLSDSLGAVSDVYKGLELDSVSFEAWPLYRWLAYYKLSRKNHKEFLKYAHKTNALKPLTVGYQDMAYSYYFLGDYNNAINNIDIALRTKKYSQLDWAFYYMGLSYMHLGDNEKAKENLQKSHYIGNEAAGVKLDSLNNLK